MDYMDVMGLWAAAVSYVVIMIAPVMAGLLDWWKRKNERKDDGD